MKILIVGSKSDYAIERYYMKYLQELGAEVYHYPSADIIFNYHSKNLINKVLFKTKIKTNYHIVNIELINIAYKFKPDVILIFKGMEIFPETLNKLRKDFMLANYNPDHPFIISGPGSGNNNVTEGVGLYHLHFCYQKSLQKQIENSFRIPTVFLPFAVETTDIEYRNPDDIEEIYRVCFQANPDQYRVNKLELLTESGIEVDVYGHGWEKTRLKFNKKVNIQEIATRSDFWKKNQEYRIQLNLFREHTLDSHNMRTFEIPAVGGIQLSPYSKEQEDFFKDGKEIFFFRDDKEMVTLAHRVMAFEKNKALEVRMAGRKRFMESGYTFADRANTVYDTFLNSEW